MLEELERAQDPVELARRIKDRLCGEHQARPRHDEWTLTDAVYGMAETAVEGDARARLATAVLLLLQELADTPEERRVLLEWPAGLFRVAGRVVWSGDERVKLAEIVQMLAKTSGHWPVGKDSVDGLSSPRLEFFRLARIANPDDEEIRNHLERTISWLEAADIPFASAEGQNREFGSLLGIWAAQGFKKRALEYFLKLHEESRDRVFRAFVQEFERWDGDGAKLQSTLLRQYDSNTIPMGHSAPSYLDQLWAARAAVWIGEPVNDHVRKTIERFTATPPLPKTTPRPAFAKSQQSAEPVVSP